MIYKEMPLWSAQEYHYPAAGGFVPRLAAYLHDEDDRQRPAVVVTPGGAYCFVAPGEGEPVAEAFYEKGYNTFVVVYTTNPCFLQPLEWQPLNDLARAVRTVRVRAQGWHLDAGRVAVCGFSAGGHLAASLAVHWAHPAVQQDPVSCRPDAVLLSYPVIFCGPCGHEGSARALLGDAPAAERVREMTLDAHVTRDTPPVFLWHTRTDATVPVENSLAFARALQQHNVPYELHVFPTGAHGATLANERWKSDENGRLDAHCQYFLTARREIETRGAKQIYPNVDLTQFATFDDLMAAWTRDHAVNVAARACNESIAQWPMLADLFLRGVW